MYLLIQVQRSHQHFILFTCLLITLHHLYAGHYHYKCSNIHLSATYYVLGTGLETGDAKRNQSSQAVGDNGGGH